MAYEKKDTICTGLYNAIYCSLNFACHGISSMSPIYVFGWFSDRACCFPKTLPFLVVPNTQTHPRISPRTSNNHLHATATT
jgi:hypothetical protein